MATEDARYRQSSQYRLWSFSPSQLADLRAKTNALAVTSISDRRAQHESHDAGSASEPDGALPEFLTPADEKQLVDYYTVELLRAGKFMGHPTDIQATAAVFLRRFYVTNSIMTYPPTEMLKTALFFGAKAEGFYTSLNGFAEKFPNTKRDNILAGEYLLCQGIRFSFDVRHPFRALEGAVMELRRYGDIDDHRISEAHKRAREILKFSPLVTDVYFHYTPSQIMLAALSLADRGLVERIIQETFHHAKDETDSGGTPAETTRTNSHKAAKKEELDRDLISGPEVRDKVLSKIEACREMLATEPPERYTEHWGRPESNNIIKPLTKKLRKCHDPDRWDLVALQKAKKEGTIKLIRGDRGASLEQDGAVFGPDPGPATADLRETKRRKVSKLSNDSQHHHPFGRPCRREKKPRAGRKAVKMDSPENPPS